MNLFGSGDTQRDPRVASNYRPPRNLSHPGGSFDVMKTYSIQEAAQKALEAFAEAEQALSEAGIGFTVVEEPTGRISETPLAA